MYRRTDVQMCKRRESMRMLEYSNREYREWEYIRRTQGPDKNRILIFLLGSWIYIKERKKIKTLNFILFYITVYKPAFLGLPGWQGLWVFEFYFLLL